MSVRVELERELRGPTTASETLTEAEVADLLGLFKEAQDKEHQALMEGIDGMLRLLPPAFRPITKRIMFGDSIER